MYTKTMHQKWRSWYALLKWVSCCFLLSLLGMACESTRQLDKLGILKTDAANHLVLFSNAKANGISSRRFTLYNDGRITVQIDSMKLLGEDPSIFRIQPTPTFPLELKPGITNGLHFEVEFHPKSKGIYRGSIAFGSPNVENVDDSGFFYVHLFSQVIAHSTSKLAFGCGGNINFGKRTRNTNSDQSCDLTNLTDSAITITNVKFKRIKGGSVAFRWLGPSLPLKLESKEKVSVTIRFTAGESVINQGEFWLETDPPQATGAPKLAVQGESNR